MGGNGRARAIQNSNGVGVVLQNRIVVILAECVFEQSLSFIEWNTARVPEFNKKRDSGPSLLTITFLPFILLISFILGFLLLTLLLCRPAFIANPISSFPLSQTNFISLLGKCRSSRLTRATTESSLVLWSRNKQTTTMSTNPQQPPPLHHHQAPITGTNNSDHTTTTPLQLRSRGGKDRPFCGLACPCHTTLPLRPLDRAKPTRIPMAPQKQPPQSRAQVSNHSKPLWLSPVYPSSLTRLATTTTARGSPTTRRTMMTIYTTARMNKGTMTTITTAEVIVMRTMIKRIMAQLFLSNHPQHPLGTARIFRSNLGECSPKLPHHTLTHTQYTHRMQHHSNKIRGIGYNSKRANAKTKERPRRNPRLLMGSRGGPRPRPRESGVHGACATRGSQIGSKRF